MSFVGADLWTRFFEGDRLACARVISAVENDAESLPTILDRVIPSQRGGVRIGVTGPPGVGKSTVTAALARLFLEAGCTVGILAVDPTSPFSGGAFLGDRVRMQDLGNDSRVFIRSMASRDGHGGLSPAAPYAADVLDAFGMDRIFIETVGVGQAEMDVLDCSDIVVLVLQPGTGDVIQALKAGILEAADLFLINKSDLPGADALHDSLRFLMDISPARSGRPFPTVLEAAALLGRGMDRAAAEIDRLIAEGLNSGRFREKRLRRLEQEIRAAVQRELWTTYASLANADVEIRAAAENLLARRSSPYPYIRSLCARIRLDLTDERVSRG